MAPRSRNSVSAARLHQPVDAKPDCENRKTCTNDGTRGSMVAAVFPIRGTALVNPIIGRHRLANGSAGDRTTSRLRSNAAIAPSETGC
jgi:hypothetical protein